jgi:hypothetical protein
MPSRRRSRNKNLGNNLADVQRRLRNMERRPVRTKLQNRVVTTAAIAVNAVGPDEVSFGTTVITSDPVNTIENPKDGLLVINESAGTTSVYSEEQRNYIQLPAVDDDARTVANGKNTIYYQSSEPTGGTYAVDDTWFDSDDGYKMYTWNGSAWSGFQLGNNAIAQISATKITAGSLAAGVIVTSNISAGQINAGSLNSGVIVTSSLNANLITTGTITGITFQTSTPGAGATDRAIQITNSDDILFFTNADEIGIVTVVNTNLSGGTDDDTWTWTDAVVMAGLEGTVPAQGTAPFPFVAASGSGSSGIAGLFGNNNNYIYADLFSVTLQGDVITGGATFASQADVIDFRAGWSDTDGELWRVEINSRLVLTRDDEQGPLSEGSGQPPTPDPSYLHPGQVVFRYT